MKFRKSAAIAVFGAVAVVTGTALPANAASADIKYVAPSDAKLALEVCQDDGGCWKTFDPLKYDKYMGPEHQVGDTVYNYSSTPMTHAMSWSDTTGNSTTVSVSAKVGVNLWQTVTASVTTTWSNTWNRSSTVSQTDTLTVPACNVGWMTRAPEMAKATGTLYVHYSNGALVIIPDAEFTAPTGKDALMVRSRPMTDAERASCAPGAKAVVAKTPAL